MEVLVRHMKCTLLREAAAECLLEVVTKGMEPMPKVQLVESLCTVLEAAGLLNDLEVSMDHFIAGSLIHQSYTHR